MIESVELRNFRNHTETRLDFSPTLTLIHGPNGAGKTSVLESVYCLYRGSGFKGSDRDLVREGADWFRVDLHDEGGSRRLSYDLGGERAVKKFIIDDKEYARLPAKHKQPIILFSPDDLLLLTGSPSRRRRYLDTMISQINPQYPATLRRYERALVQRNKLLKSPVCTPDLLFSWNVLLSELGSVIIGERYRTGEYLNAKVTEYYRAISLDTARIGVSYEHQPVTSRQLLAAYDACYGRDLAVGATTVGPHRHDLAISMNGRSAMDVASRGENRTIILVLKQLELDYVIDATGREPLVLLDDVLGELDTRRQAATLEMFSRYQTIITGTHASEIATPLQTIELL